MEPFQLENVNFMTRQNAYNANDLGKNQQSNALYRHTMVNQGLDTSKYNQLCAYNASKYQY